MHKRHYHFEPRARWLAVLLCDASTSSSCIFVEVFCFVFFFLLFIYGSRLILWFCLWLCSMFNTTSHWLLSATSDECHRSASQWIFIFILNFCNVIIFIFFSLFCYICSKLKLRLNRPINDDDMRWVFKTATTTHSSSDAGPTEFLGLWKLMRQIFLCFINHNLIINQRSARAHKLMRRWQAVTCAIFLPFPSGRTTARSANLIKFVACVWFEE